MCVCVGFNPPRWFCNLSSCAFWLAGRYLTITTQDANYSNIRTREMGNNSMVPVFSWISENNVHINYKYIGKCSISRYVTDLEWHGHRDDLTMPTIQTYVNTVTKIRGTTVWHRTATIFLNADLRWPINSCMLEHASIYITNLKTDNVPWKPHRRVRIVGGKRERKETNV